MKEITNGYKQSKLSNKENKFIPINKFKIPEEYSHERFLPEVEDQTNINMCIPYAISVYLDWNFNIYNKENTKKNNNIDKKQIYKARKTPGNNGMTFKEALDFLKNNGVMTDFGIFKIKNYLFIDSELALKQAILLNGPCMAAIKVKNEEHINDFWEGVKTYGAHAVAIIGYNKEGFIFRNSWGKSYGNNGYYILPYNKFYNITEIWTITDL